MKSFKPTTQGRRRFLWQTGSAAGLMLASSNQRVFASQRIRVGAIGVGGRGSLLIEQLPETAQIVAVADCNEPRAQAFRDKLKADWQIYSDYRKILDRNDIDAVIVATGEFQRIRPCIEACMAGKDVYAEKPLTLYIKEGRALVNEARKYKRIVQVGTQQRSMEMNRVACQLIRNGGLGKILEVRAVAYGGPDPSPVQGFPTESIPKGLDWNMWLNQASERPFNGQWLGWMRWRDFGGGQMTNWGAHGVDQIQWALGTDQTGPVEIEPLTSGLSGQVRMKYANGVVVNFVIEQGKGPMGGAIFICEKGKLEINRNKFTSNPPEIADQLRKELDVTEEERKWSDDLALWQARWHLQNWLDCIKSRQLPVADVEIGHRSVSVCHLANIVRELQRPLRWDPAEESFVNDSEADKLLSRLRRKGFELPS
ncbi:MAG: Gfo/Idh/MocA family protein [Planctomycetota bacterium]|jgi:predicted dehydrogenase